jgi:hypothetical protein
MTLVRFAAIAVLGALLTVGCALHYVCQGNGHANFYLRRSQAREVALATSLDGFVPHKARRIGVDLWVVSVNASRDFSYFYLVDGKALKPDCRMVEEDGFGGFNCVYLNIP